MALQVGELFASLTVDTGGAEQAMERVMALGRETADALGRTLGLDLGQEIGAGVAAGLAAGMSPDAGQAIGSAFGQGVVQGIGAMRGSILAAASGVGEAAASALRGALDVHSPSGVTREIGRYFDAGLLTGMQEGAPAIGRAAERIGALAADTLAQALPSAGGPRRAQAEGTAEERGTASGSAATAQRAQGGEGSFARLVAAALSGVTVQLDGRTVGSLVAPAVGQALTENIIARRYGTE